MSAPPIVSVHVPKCSGSSLKSVWRIHFGQAAVLEDYGDRPADPRSPMNRDQEAFLKSSAVTSLPDPIRVVHGHFWARKYQNLVPKRLVSFIRHPVGRLISKYC
jgi:hypothetical protein